MLADSKTTFAEWPLISVPPSRKKPQLVQLSLRTLSLDKRGGSFLPSVFSRMRRAECSNWQAQEIISFSSSAGPNLAGAGQTGWPLRSELPWLHAVQGRSPQLEKFKTFSAVLKFKVSSVASWSGKLAGSCGLVPLVAHRPGPAWGPNEGNWPAPLVLSSLGCVQGRGIFPSCKNGL